MTLKYHICRCCA